MCVFSFSSSGLANFVVVPKPPPVVRDLLRSGQTDKLVRLRNVAGDQSLMSPSALKKLIAPEAKIIAQSVLNGNMVTGKDKAALRAVAAAPVVELTEDQKLAAMVQYNPDNKMWFDPKRGGWTATRPAYAPAGKEYKHSYTLARLVHVDILSVASCIIAHNRLYMCLLCVCV